MRCLKHEIDFADVLSMFDCEMLIELDNRFDVKRGLRFNLNRRPRFCFCFHPRSGFLQVP